ncbi:hypothetical protein [Nocardia sp. NPDC050710]|uniref:hypothetical protein n=1 Tax=Nocardia sp. NPDC050710 TaxID=3157220 RepID=UPI0033DACBD0
MSDRYAYFVYGYDYLVRDEIERLPYSEYRSSSVWRCAEDKWECFKFRDRQWHPVVGHMKVPDHAAMQPITAERASELVRNKALWTRYFAYYSSENDWDIEQSPTTVVRTLINGPDLKPDEIFWGRQRGWTRTLALIEFLNQGRHSKPPHLVEIDANDADRIVWEVFDIRGATEL